MARRKRRPSKSNRLGMFVIAAIVVVLLIGLLVQSQDLADSNAKKEARKEARKEELQQQIKDEEIRAEEIERLAEDITSPDNVEKIAREKLGLVYEDDISFQPEEE